VAVAAGPGTGNDDGYASSDDRPEGVAVRVLVATDRPDLGHALTLFLSERRVHVLDVVGDADELLALAISDRPDAVLVDWRLGEDVSTRMVSGLVDGEHPTPVIVLTTARERERARRSGATALATLGDHPDALLATLLEMDSGGTAG
jgi:DNA-binding response OmpR family regulator